MEKLAKHNNILRGIYESLGDSNHKEITTGLIDLDSIDSILRTLLSIDEMREAGSFFTGKKLAELSIINVGLSNDDQSSVVLDPTCGAGNLLIASTSLFNIYPTLSQTLERWGKRLYGFDLYESFIDAAKLRIIFEAINRGAIKDCSLEEAMDYLSNIYVRDVMSLDHSALKDISHIVMNPPFSIWESPKTGIWKQGRVNAAGIVLEHVLLHAPKGAKISAILPDVLRSGSRYNHWRKFISQSVNAYVKTLGRFNPKTDVDVFLLYGEVYENNKEIKWNERVISDKDTVVSDHFDVRVGPLVAYRDPLEGINAPYIHSKNSPPWSTIDKFTEYRKFNGKLIETPFVVIRRTSSPSDKERVIATLVACPFSKVAVENHLIILRPKNGLLEDCHWLLTKLRSESVNAYINDVIRCRHLTVGVVKEIPTSL
ncbi:SAM-dependent methyltransferase [Aeromonas hydrophila]|uniref:N-6 DNA methylase n=1 Tax=Aeromonas hydrophila TaxID=644 RepID=UPI001A299A6B|nr:N-6 DNA methylase [Aeromonas hydrophila]MCP3244116.1 SAM-dependent methyltransferase [Aeromonas hydrophila]HAU4899741.1 SAM-dependent DNA methyltransferase [Aeromonas hydrophila]